MPLVTPEEAAEVAELEDVEVVPDGLVSVPLKTPEVIMLEDEVEAVPVEPPIVELSVAEIVVVRPVVDVR